MSGWFIVKNTTKIQRNPELPKDNVPFSHHLTQKYTEGTFAYILHDSKNFSLTNFSSKIAQTITFSHNHLCFCWLNSDGCYLEPSPTITFLALSSFRLPEAPKKQVVPGDVLHGETRCFKAETNCFRPKTSCFTAKNKLFQTLNKNRNNLYINVLHSFEA